MRGSRLHLPILFVVALSMGCASHVHMKYESPTGGPASRPSPQRHASAPVAKHAPLRIPPGHLPPPGSCRIWVPGTPPGHQSPPGDCARLARAVPVGAWLVHRSVDDPKHVAVTVYDAKRPGIVVEIGVFVAATGEFVALRSRP
jgi:hypothetical protein